MAKKESLFDKFEEINRHTMAHFFLGVGLTVFLLNAISFSTIYPFLKQSQLGLMGPFFGHYMSFATSILLVIFSAYEMFKHGK